MNPIPYNKLFDIDGLKQAIKEAEAESNKFGAAATEDFKRINTVVKALTKSLQEAKNLMSTPIKLMDEGGQQQIRDLAKQVADLTQQYKTQKAAIDALKGVMEANKAAISDAKVQSAQYEAQLKKERVATQEARTATAQLTLQMKQQAQANREAAQAQTAATGSYKEAQQRLSALGREIRNTEGGFKSLTPELKDKVRQYNILNDALKKFDAQMGNHQRNVGNYGGALSKVTDNLQGLLAGYLSITGALMAARQVFDTAMKTDATKTSLAFIMGGEDIADAKLKQLAETAERLGLEFTSLTASYTSFIGAAKASNFALGEAEGIFNAVSGAGARLHLSADQISGSLLAIQQMISKGTVQAEELRGQLGERLPGAFAIAARAMGVTEMQLNSMLKSGEVLASDLLPKLTVELNKTFGLDSKTKIDSMSAAWNRFKNAFSTAVSENSNISKFFTTILTGIGDVSSALLKTVNSSSWKEFGLRIGGFASAMRGDISGMFVNRTLADNVKSGGNKNAPIDAFVNASQKEQIELLKVQAQIRDAAYEKAKSGRKEDIAWANQQQAFMVKIKTMYDDFYHTKQKISKLDKEDTELNSIKEIRDRITLLSKSPNSAIDGSDVNNRIDALKARLKELNTGATKTAKEGLQLLEEQLSKVSIQLQTAIVNDYAKNQGKETENTKQLADAYVLLANKIKDVQQAQKDQQEAAQKRLDYANRSNNPALSASGTRPTDLAGGIATASTKGYLIKELEDTEKLLQQIDFKYSDANQKIFEKYKARKITITQYNDEIQKSQDKQADEVFQKDIKVAQLRLKLAETEYGKGSKEYIASLKNLGDIQERYNKESLTRDERMFAAKLKLQGEVIQLLQNGASAVAKATGNSGLGQLFGDVSTNLVNGIGDSERFQKIAEMGIDAVNAYTEFAINASNARIEQLNKEKEHDLSLAGDNKEAKVKIEEEYNKKIAAEKTKQAKNARAAAAIDIIINTAVAVSKTIGQTGILGIGLAPIIAALGAVELGIVLSQPLPQYEKGRKGGKAELAEVNERGPELIGQRGKWRLANRGMRGVTYLNQGDEVRTATDTKQMLANGMVTADGQYVTNVSQSKAIYDQYIMASSKATAIDYDKMSGAVADGVSGLPITEHNWNDRGYQQNVRIKNTRIMDINRRNRF